MALMRIELHLVLVLQTTLAVVFFAAALTKLVDRGRFERVVLNWAILPPPLVPTVAATLPWIELSLAPALLMGLMAPWTALAATGLLTAFTVAMGANLARGRTEVPCGCFGAQGAGRLSWALLCRTLALAGAAGVLAAAQTAPRAERLTPGEAAGTVALSVATLTILWLGHTTLRL
jgi:putative oxidoreductase